MRVVIVLLVACLVPVAARASDLVVSVRTPKGAPIADAVVTVRPAAGEPQVKGFGQPLQLAQRDKMFDPFVLVVPVGAVVSFPNRDPIHHQVYSFSPAKKFELKLYGREESRTVTFDKPGIVAVGCNIHDTMVAFIDVTSAPFAVKTDKAGRAVIQGLPAGSAEVGVWHPHSKAPLGEQRLSLTLPRDGVVEQAVTTDLRTPPLRSGAY